MCRYVKKIFLFLYLTAVTFSRINIYAQEENVIIASAGNINITLEEFNNRFQLMPHFADKNINPDSAKKEFLFAIIAEKLWAQKAIKQGLDTTNNFQLSIQSLRELLLKDELYRDIVINKIVITGEEINEGINKFSKLLSIEMFASKDSLPIYNFYSGIKNRLPIDSLLSVDSSLIYSKNENITFGDFENTELQDTIFSLAENEFTVPFKTQRGWIVAKLISKKVNPRIINEKQDVVKNIVYKKIFDKKAAYLSSHYLDSVLGGLKVNVDYNLFYKIEKLISDVIKERGRIEYDSTNVEYVLDETNFQYLTASKRDFTGKEIFIKLPFNYKTPDEFLYYLSHQKFSVNKLTKEEIESMLHKTVRGFIEQAILSEESRKKGLYNSPSFNYDEKLWSENYLAQLSMNRLYQSIELSEDELLSFYKEKFSPNYKVPQVNILEIQNPDLNIIGHILKELEAGKDFRELAKRYSVRTELKKSGGEWGYFPVTEGGEIGKAAAGIKLNEIYGPIKTPEGYSLIKLIGRREFPDLSKTKFDEIKSLLKTQLRLKKFEDSVNIETAKLAEELGLNINYEILKKAEVSPLKIFTVRYIGFGGKITAMPLSIPIYSWYKNYINKSKTIP